MGRFDGIGAAVIGSGFIGTVRIENLRRLGVNVRCGSSVHAGPASAMSTWRGLLAGGDGAITPDSPVATMP